ncbi:Penicillin-binding protein activator LpoA [Pseudoalteromonas sp. CIP111854]|uniref:Penicillin-binding protein activator LpoA n=1 Tax=Pseudoalteromonas holothuriae TaxID=2963714 RepID=A0A9W4R163_9GAMM|nr:penicillin-binding protein activator [Pseudoalteromonas sp. CIP111854]CAH9063441.1 Penicillin-binding protein activator LpoA [Pseudoalteromonas sp. CIP111854]
MRLKIISLVIAILSGLSACSTTEKVPTENAKPKNQQTKDALDTSNALALFEKAKTKQGVNRIQLLYLARDAAISNQQWRVLEQVSLALESKMSVDHVQNRLYIALARKQQGRSSAALAILRNLEQQLSLPEHQAWHQYLIGSIYASEGLPNQALHYFFNAANLSAQNNLTLSGLNDELWQALQQLSSFALEKLNSGSVIQQGWIKLAKYQLVYLGMGVQLHQALNNWQRRFVNHPASYLLPEKVSTAVSLVPYNAQRLAILLPQSGNSERFGRALKNGFLAALDKQNITEVFFIDETQSIEEIEQALALNQVDFVIGPLLKSNIDKLASSNIVTALPTIYLNTPSQLTHMAQHYYFALNPEHEVEQALVHFLSKEYQKPMLLAPDNNSGHRLINHFQQQWERFSEAKPEVGLYTDSKNMAKVVADLLEVDESKQRIKSIKSLFREEVESETRSRGDIDVVYILGDATETRLLKPYLDVNVSTFAERIPLYATSRSYSRRIDSTDKGDLEGLYFTEQPWMLPDAIQQNGLRKQYLELWPEQADIEQRLFAMAYDSIRLIPHIKQLARIPGKEFSGLTGQLSIKRDNTLTRRLSWAQYRKNKIRIVRLDETPPAPLFMRQTEMEDVQTLN